LEKEARRLQAARAEKIRMLKRLEGGGEGGREEAVVKEEETK